MDDSLQDDRTFVSLKSLSGEFLIVPYKDFKVAEVPTDPKVFIGDRWYSIDWYSLKFHHTLPQAWSRVENETAQ